ncbi:MAG: phosphatase PAP2 family protein [Acidimicrobiia bacterium]
MATSTVGWLQWQPAVVMAATSAAIGFAWWRADAGWQRATGTFCRELALVLSLYTIWILAGRLSVVRVDEGLANGRWVYHAQQSLHFPSETILQNWIIDRPWVARFTNGYYAIVHAPAMMITLLWLFVARRDRYSHWRTALAVTTFACLAIQFIPVAPPRMYPQYGFVDVARLFDQSVYGPIGQGISDQLSAMPSVHVAWALWVAAVVIDAGRSRWRWLVLGHPAATVFAVVATANHWWADGIVAGALLVIAVLLDGAVRRVVLGVREPAVLTLGVEPQPAGVVVGANDADAWVLPISTSSGSRRSST